MIGPLLREAAASARSQPIVSTVTVLVVAAMILAVMLTTGRTVGAEQEVLGSIDSAGTRSMTVRAEAGSGVTSSVLERIAAIEGIAWAAAFSVATDATNAAFPDGTKVPLRHAYGDQFARLGVAEPSPIPGGIAWASDAALQRLGLPDRTGSITSSDGRSYSVGGRIQVPDFLQALEPVLLVPQQARGDEPISTLIVIADTPELVAPVSDAVVSVIAADDPTKVTVETSQALAALRGVIEGQLGSFSRGLVIALLSLTGALVAVLLLGLVMMRRKDFGRRRALGAGRALIVRLLILQTSLLALIGIVTGSVASAILLWTSGDPWPGGTFVLALGVLTLTTAVGAAIIPAVIASNREPIRELRVP